VAGLRRLVQRYGADARSSESAAPRQSDRDVVACAQHYMRQRFAQSVRLASVAQECGLNTFHLIRVFRRVVGVPPYAYLVQLRVNRAQTMLSEGSSVADVAYSCGFSDQSHLTRTFKKVLGVPPGQYVRSIRAA
jgi:AraC-like DNA-binding protein